MESGRAARLIAALLLWATGVVAAQWHPGFGTPPQGLGLDGDPRALLHHTDGDLYCGGSFSQAGDQTAWFIARLESEPDGTRAWASLGDMDNRVDALVSWGDSLLAGGRFTTAGGVAVNRVAVYDGLAWHPVGSPASWGWSGVLALTIHDGTPWAAGSGFVVRWTGSAWEAVTHASFSGDVFALASLDTAVVAAGAFTSVTDPAGTLVPADNIAAWTGTWNAMGSGLPGTVYALETWNGLLYAGGVFTSPSPLLARWNGGGWTADWPALSGTSVIALDGWGVRLVVGGSLTGGGGSSLWNVGYLDGAVWRDMGGGVNGQVRAVSAADTEVAAGGSFLFAGGAPSEHAGLWQDEAVAVGPVPLPARLTSVAPNPFNPAVSIDFSLRRAGPARLSVHALDGRSTAVLVDQYLESGAHRAVWRGRDGAGRPVPSGCYVLRLEADGRVDSRRIMLAR